MTPIRKRVALVLPKNMFFGSAKATAIDLCALDFCLNSNMHFEIVVFCRPVAEAFDGIKVIQCDRPSRFQRLIGATGFEGALRDFDPQVILCEQHVPTAAAIANSFQQCPVIVRRHGFTKVRKNFLKKKHYARQMRKLAHVICVSESVRSNLIDGLPQLVDKSTTVHNGIDLNIWKPAGNKEKIIVFVGRCVPEKGIVEAAEGCARFLSDNPEWRAVFVCANDTDNPQIASAVRQWVKKAGDQMRLRFQLPSAEVAALLAKARISIVPSKWQEPFGRTAIESMASGCALITSGTGGLDEIVDEECAWILPDVNGDEILRGLREVSSSSQLIEKYARNGRERVAARFDIARVSTKMDAILDAATVRRTTLQSKTAR